MDNKKRMRKLKAGDYQRLFGVKKETFDKMMEVLEKAYIEKHKKGGKPPKLTILDKLIITLQYYREYRTMEHIAFDYGVYKSTVCDAIHWVEEVLVKGEAFHLPSKTKIAEDESIKNVAVDVTEVEIERPKKNKKNIIQERKNGIQ